MDVRVGEGLFNILTFLTNMIKIDFLHKEFKSGEYIYHTIKGFLKIRKLFLLRNKHLIKAE